jgi:hypothetical protein
MFKHFFMMALAIGVGIIVAQFVQSSGILANVPIIGKN